MFKNNNTVKIQPMIEESINISIDTLKKEKVKGET